MNNSIYVQNGDLKKNVRLEIWESGQMQKQGWKEAPPPPKDLSFSIKEADLTKDIEPIQPTETIVSDESNLGAIVSAKPVEVDADSTNAKSLDFSAKRKDEMIEVLSAITEETEVFAFFDGDSRAFIEPIKLNRIKEIQNG